ncbi:hypothetical protein D9758_012345 [Tetrapyrgos nigripes]|uniref:Transmembrane protein n=1 Tax=Tetrapyrgos nigripes TaxID=182062 RepID=A0A8H5FPU1_9AGAR|nr:hypothetical protein D9758_012345 [Tetrapyrgos nigripes]
MKSVLCSTASKIHLLFLYWLTLHLNTIHSLLLNFTVEETDPRIVYTGSSWIKNEGGPLYHGGFHDQTEDRSASAVFNFTGVAIYYYSSLWPFDVTTVLTLDGHDKETLNLTAATSSQQPNGDPAKENATIRWSRTGLEDGPHSLVVSGGSFVLVDAFRYTVNQSEAADTSNTTSQFQNITLTYKIFVVDWVKNEPNALYHGGAQSQNQDVSANAIFSFTGTAVYYYASLWPYRVTTVVSIDGEPGETIDLTDPSVPDQQSAPPTVQSSIRWRRTNLTEGNHTLTISTGSYAIVDAITYTRDEFASPDSNSTSQQSDPTPSAPANSSSTTKTGLLIGLVGGLLGFMLVVAMILVVCLYSRLRRLQKPSDPNPMVQRGRGNALLPRRPRNGRVSPYTITSPNVGLSIDTVTRSYNAYHADERGLSANAISPTETIRTQTTRKGGYSGFDLSSPQRLQGVPHRQWDAPPPSYRG